MKVGTHKILEEAKCKKNFGLRWNASFLSRLTL